MVTMESLASVISAARRKRKILKLRVTVETKLSVTTVT